MIGRPEIDEMEAARLDTQRLQIAKRKIDALADEITKTLSASVERGIAIRKLQEARMWLGESGK